MNTLNVEMEFPRDILNVLDVSENQIGNKLRELIVLELVRNGRISTGKGAEILNMSKFEFIGILSKNDIPYFTESPEELERQVEVAESKARGTSK